MTNDQLPNTNEKLVDFDWQIKHVMGSSSYRPIEDTLTQITFHTIDQSSASTSAVKKNVTVEFNKSELKNLITILRTMKQN